ncbi:hypothetical protein PsAD2_03508 [Pseudovibrio axinellae]|uniref:Glycosidase n=1 Tax=Pseudovibrio axinellae TaxID=989403 RepID=A0A161V9D8_9HYPH|nr:hypothetical protein [Pseudovibrio axinellae]KZL15863.1 hypothetical protein PsAD2_03508 [Pseudovibrio axinellae]SER82973.1 hypothetical protein SAMN05421798_1312 [Pseudovibrio axinellae]
MLNFKSLKGHQFGRLKVLQTVFPELSNIFNPSVLLQGGCIYIAFRAMSAQTSTIDAFYTVLCSKTLKPLVSRNLSRYFLEAGLSKVADPKLFLFNQRVFVTFNSGYSKENNSLYLADLDSKDLVAKEIIYDARNRVEKNWAFFASHGELFALYSINPLTVLRNVGPVDKKQLVFEKVFEKQHGDIPDFSIGTQLVELRNGRHLFVAHQKTQIGKKRLYWGVPCLFERSGSDFSLQRSPVKLFHSVKSLMGEKTKHNKNLLSCTYFSGASVQGDELILSYGINDLDYGLAKIRMSGLWN